MGARMKKFTRGVESFYESFSAKSAHLGGAHQGLYMQLAHVFRFFFLHFFACFSPVQSFSTHSLFANRLARRDPEGHSGSTARLHQSGQPIPPKNSASVWGGVTPTYPHDS